MNNAKKLYDALCIKHPDGLKSISDLSKNTEGVSGGKKYITCEHRAFNYDLVLNCATTAKRKEKSPDALFLNDETLHFVEFKEGGIKKNDIRQKIHEGLVTLFQFAVQNHVLTRDQFLSLKFHYVVIIRPQDNPMAAALELSIDTFGLKNMEGFLLNRTFVYYTPKRILELLHSITGKKIQSIDYHSPNGNLETLNI